MYFQIVVDRSIIGLASNDEAKEIRFVVEKFDQKAMDATANLLESFHKILTLLTNKGERRKTWEF
jgi:hypothetical protein